MATTWETCYGFSVDKAGDLHVSASKEAHTAHIRLSGTDHAVIKTPMKRHAHHNQRRDSRLHWGNQIALWGLMGRQTSIRLTEHISAIPSMIATKRVDAADLYKPGNTTKPNATQSKPTNKHNKVTLSKEQPESESKVQVKPKTNKTTRQCNAKNTKAT